MKAEIGYSGSIDLRHETCTAPVADRLTVLYLSDLHLNRFGNTLITSLEHLIQETAPDLILLGGDYVDFPGGWQHLERLARFLSGYPHVYAVAGNHDFFYGIRRVRALMAAHGITWLEQTTADLILRNTRIHLAGNRPSPTRQAGDLCILCLHKPLDITPFSDSYDLVFAGHLHGGQCVLWQTEKGLYPGRFFYRFNFLKATVGKCLYLVSKGLGDTLPVRYNCRKEALLVTVEQASG